MRTFLPTRWLRNFCFFTPPVATAPGFIHIPKKTCRRHEAEKFLTLIHRRANGEPTQHLTGKQEFWGLEFIVTPDVLIPRPETEHLVEVALDRLAVREVRAGRDPRLTGENLTLVDIGTGSGCIAVALAKELPAATVYATDISPKALEVAKENAARHGSAGQIHFHRIKSIATLSRHSPLPTRHFFSI